jgi:dTDP-4-dehydrorhamnose reductase
VVAAGRESADLADPDQICDLVRRVRPAVILNAAAYTAVDRAESEPERAMAINALAPRILADEALRSDALLVHYSTDYVFDGQKSGPWTEEDAPAPLNVYGASKLAGEQAIRESGARHLIFRTSWVYGVHGSNFLLTMLRLGRQRGRISVVDDQSGAPTSSIELARVTRQIVDGALAGQFGGPEVWAGLYHMTCAGSTSWCGFAQAIFARAGKLLEDKSPLVIPISSVDYPAPAARPRNSVLSNARLEARFGVRLVPWQTALNAVIEKLG